MYAEMLKADGYATSSTYVNTLCKTVETYGLSRYDHGGGFEYVIGQTYTTQQDLNVRTAPDGDLKSYTDLTDNAKLHAFVSANGNAVLKRGTRVTVQDIKADGSTTWLQIPSGWICGKNSKNIYVI